MINNFDVGVYKYLECLLLKSANIIEQKILNISLILSNIYSFSEYQTYPRPSHPIISKRKDTYFTMVAILISIRTTLENEKKATDAFLKRYKDINDVLSSSINEISEVIKCAGMAVNKAKNIFNASLFVKEKFNNSWNFLKKISINEAREYILCIPGVGEKSADCILELGLDLPSIAIDINMLRVISRIFDMPWAKSPNLSDKYQLYKCKSIIEDNVLNDAFLFQIIHTLLLLHGKFICKSIPKCKDCIISKYCSNYNKLII